VGIRTFWWQDERLCFGTGAGITWGSDPQGEWDETELKAARLLAVASGSHASSPHAPSPHPSGPHTSEPQPSSRKK